MKFKVNVKWNFKMKRSVHVIPKKKIFYNQNIKIAPENFWDNSYFSTPNQISCAFFAYLPECLHYRSKIVCEQHFTLTLSGFLCTKICCCVFVLSHQPPPCFYSFLAIPLPNTVTICAKKNKAGRVCDLLFDSKAASESIGATDTVISERTCLKKNEKSTQPLRVV